MLERLGIITQALVVGGGGESDAPVYDSGNADHILHVFEDWSGYANVAAIEGEDRHSDGGGPWIDVGADSFGTSDPDPWYGGSRYLICDMQTVPESGSVSRCVTLRETGSGTAEFLNRTSAKDSVVFEWAWKNASGSSASYEGKIMDWQPYAGTDRFNYQTNDGSDHLGEQLQADCTSDDLCSLFYTNANGTGPILSDSPPNSHPVGGSIARSISSDTWFYNQVRGYPDVDWDSAGASYLDNTWHRTILRFTNNAGGVMGRGRIEEWFQTDGSDPIKVMEYIGDVGQLHEGQVRGRDTSQGTGTITDSAEFHLYNLTAQWDIFAGGLTLHVGGFRMWSHSRLTL